jgi:hypothetical protein
MIYDLTLALKANFEAKGAPVRVVYGPEPTESISAARERVVIWEPLDEKRDSVQGPKATHPNPRQPRVLVQSCRLRVFSQSTTAAALWHEHVDRARQILVHTIAGLDRIVRGRKNTITWGPGGFVSLVDSAGKPLWSGAVYELDFYVDHGVPDWTWKFEGADTATIGTDVEIENVTKVSAKPGAAGDPPDDAETIGG